MRSSTALAGLGLLLSLASCGNQAAPPGEGALPTGVDLSGEVVLAASPYQPSAQEPVVLCFGPQAAIYPPSCSGPELEGEFTWADYDVQREGEITWTDQTLFAVGRYDPDVGEHGIFTLTRPLRSDPPEGYRPRDGVRTDFPTLCEDPTADVAGVDQAARTQGPAGADEEQALLALLGDDLPGYSTSWLSAGGVMNVLLADGTDVDSSRAAIREVYTGPLCLEVRDVPSEADLRAAQDALAARSDLKLLGVGSGGSDPRLHVEVVVADRATIEAINEAAAPWLTPQQIVIIGAVQALNP